MSSLRCKIFGHKLDGGTRIDPVGVARNKSGVEQALFTGENVCSRCCDRVTTVKWLPIVEWERRYTYKELTGRDKKWW